MNADARFHPKRWPWIVVTLLALVLASSGWLQMASTVADPVPLAPWEPPSSFAVEVGWTVLSLAEVALLPLGFAVWWLLGRPSLRAAPDAPSGAPWAWLMVFVWWSALDEGGVQVLGALIEDPVAFDAAWWCWLTLTLVVLHRAFVGPLGRHLRGGWRWPAVGVGVAAVSIATGASYAWLGLVDLGLVPLEGVLPTQAGVGDDLLAVLGDVGLTVIVAPVVEEVAYRGLLLGGLRALLPDAAALAISAILFAAVHDYGLEGTVLMLVTGLVLGRLALGTGSLLAPIVCHAAGNAIAVAYEVVPRLLE